MTGRKSPSPRRTEPVLEALESRRLLNARVITPGGKEINDKDLAHFQFVKANGVPLSDRQINYVAPGGAKVQLTLLGSGTLAGTTVRPDGALDVVYNKTTATSKIIGHITGGPGRAPLASLRDADVVAGSPAAAGSDPINVVNLKKFNLIDGGNINIQGGVGTLALASAGSNTQIHVAALPASSSSSGTNNTNSSANNNTVIVGTPVITGGTQTTTVASPNATSSTPAPTGAAISIPIVRGARRSTPLGNPQIFGFDATSGNLVRFDATTGAALQSIPVPGGGTAMSGVGLGSNGGRLTALVGSGSTVFAFDAVTGAPVGQFSTTSLAAQGLSRVDGIGSNSTRTFVSDASAGANGLIQGIDVTASLRTGQAVADGLPFSPLREFELTGGLTGLAGTDSLYATGAANFDAFTPDRNEVGILTFTPGTPLTAPRESSRTAIPNPLAGGFVDAGPPGSAQASASAALGSIGPNLALVSAVTNGKNIVTLLNPSTEATVGVVALNDPNRLSGLSESFHPEFQNAALVDVTGNLLNFVSDQATGLVLNSSGTVNLVSIHSATDTVVVGRPLNHVAIPRRQNVQLLSTARGTGGKDKSHGVTVNPTLAPLGVLTLP